MTSDAAGTLQEADSISGAPDVRQSGSLSASGTNLLITWTCPTGAGTVPATYSATPSQLELHVVLTDGSTLVNTFTKQ
jgi:hypothetical protein